MEETVKLISMVRQDAPSPIPPARKTIPVFVAITFAVLAMGLALILSLVYFKKGF